VEVVASLSQGRTAAAQCGLFTQKSVPVIFEPPCIYIYRGAEKSLARPGRNQSRKYVRDARDFNIETRAVIKFFSPLQGKAPKEIHAILTETLACFLSGQAKDLSAPCIYMNSQKAHVERAGATVNVAIRRHRNHCKVGQLSQE